jgi:hypothetical protein
VQFPVLIAVQPDSPGASLIWAALGRGLSRFETPLLGLPGDWDLVAQGWAPHCVPKAGCLVQEDLPDEPVERILSFLDVS